ncbi:MAG: thermonuclease family protein [Alphaproteobacteria bacterium]|nr:thermonuclease family protein [Alphaproteobacteria bacterium]
MRLPTAIITALLFGAIAGFYLPDLITADNEGDKSPVSSVKTIIDNDIQGYATVTDGDTIKINGVRIRFHGIDAPEMKQPCWKDGIEYQCGLVARDYLIEIINNEPVICQFLSEDQYGRKVSKCYNYENNDIEAKMVSRGMATAYLYYSRDYEAEQIQAKNNKLGIWAGEFEEPYQYRKRN